MKFFLLFFLFAIVIAPACKTKSGFLSANEVHQTRATLIFHSHDSAIGTIDIPFENFSVNHTVNKPWIMFMPEGSSVARKITLNTIEGYRIDSAYYMLKNVDIAMDGQQRLIFVKRLTRKDSKIQLFEAAAAGPATEVAGDDRSYYFLAFPGFGPLQTINSRSSEIVPGFEHKMTMHVLDCPALARKIAAKTDGYFLPMASIRKGQIPEVLMRIINEFNECR